MSARHIFPDHQSGHHEPIVYPGRSAGNPRFSAARSAIRFTQTPFSNPSTLYHWIIRSAGVPSHCRSENCRTIICPTLPCLQRAFVSHLLARQPTWKQLCISSKPTLKVSVLTSPSKTSKRRKQIYQANMLRPLGSFFWHGTQQASHWAALPSSLRLSNTVAR